MGGAEVLLVNILKQLVNKYDIQVVYLKGKGTLIPVIEQIGIYPIRVEKLLIPNVYRNMFKHHSNRYDKIIFQGWMYHGNVISTIAHLLNRKKSSLFWSIHHSAENLQIGSWISNIKLKINAMLSRFADKVIYVSLKVKEDHIIAGFDANNAIVINNGVSTKEFYRDDADRANVRSELGISKESQVIGIVGRGHLLKDYSTFFKGMAMLLRKRSNIDILIIGRGIALTDYTEELKDLGDEELNRIHILGERNDVNRMLRSMDIYVSTSISESFSLVIMEALCSELMCASTDVICYCNDFLDALRTFPVGNEQALVDSILKILSIDREERQLIGKQARQIVIDNYSIEKVSSRYSSLWEEFYKR